MGNTTSKLEKALAESGDDERYYGLENFGNTCYCNSVLQALYFCRPFREKVLQYGQSAGRDTEDNLLNCLVELFLQASACALRLAAHCMPVHLWRWRPCHAALRGPGTCSA